MIKIIKKKYSYIRKIKRNYFNYKVDMVVNKITRIEK